MQHVFKFFLFASLFCLSTSAGDLSVAESFRLSDKQIEMNLSHSGSDEIVLTSLDRLPLPQFYYFKGGPFPGAGGSCQMVLPPHSQCKLVMEYIPPQLAAMSLRPLWDFAARLLNGK